MSENLCVTHSVELPRSLSRRRSLTQSMSLAALFMIILPTVAVTQGLSSGGTTKWEMEEMEVIVTFLLFDPNDPAVDLPKGLRFYSVSEVDAPEFQEHLKQHPEHGDWAFSFIEFARPKGWLLDGKAPTLPENGCLGVWFAPVDHSQLAIEVSMDRYAAVIAPSPDAILVLGLWVPDREYVAYMRARGHYADYGMVTLVKDSNGAHHGDMQLAELNLKASATPRGEVSLEPDPFTQVFFEPGKSVENVVVLAGRDVRERSCDAEWSRKGDHPISRGVIVGPTFLVTEGPLKGSAYRIGKKQDR